MSDQPSATILNVNNDESARYIVTRILRQAGFGVVEVGTGGEALRLARTNPDLIILDVNLPDVSGLEVCRILKADPDTSTIPVLHLSASFVQSSDRVRGLEGGADGYLTVPVEPAEIIATVLALLRMRKAEESALTGSREWQATFEAIQDGICLTDADGRIKRCNGAMAALLDRDRTGAAANLRGKLYTNAVAEAFGSDVAAPPPARPQDVPQPIVAEVCVGEEPSRRKWYLVTMDPVVGGRGSTTAVTGSVHIWADITERKNAAVAQRAFLRDVLFSLTEGRLRLCDSPSDLPVLLPEQDRVTLDKKTLRDLRKRVKALAETLDFPTARCQDFVLSVGEAGMNAVVHAGTGEAVICSDGADTLQVWITDRGGGIATEHLHRATLERGFTTAGTLGHGFWLVLRTCDHVWLLTGPEGTTLVLEQAREASDPPWLARF